MEDSQEQTQQSANPVDQVEALLGGLETDEGSKQDQVDKVDELLNGSDSDNQEDSVESDGDDDENPEDPEPAETDDNEPEKGAIDYKQEIPLSSGEKITLGELKDHYQQQAERVLAVQDRENAIGQQIAKNQMLADHLNALPPEQVEQAKAEIAETRVTELSELRKLPAFNNEANFEKSKEQIFELAKEYDLIQDVGAIVNHKALKLLHDFATLKAAVKAAGQVKPIKNKLPRGKAKPAERKASDAQKLASRAKETGSREDQISAVNALLG